MSIQQLISTFLVLRSRENRFNYCEKYIDKFQKSFYETVEPLITNNTNKKCVRNLLQRHNTHSVFFKAIAYNYFKRQLVNFKSNKTCAGVVNVLRVDDCKYREMTVKFIGDDKSLRKVRPCLDDLFGEFNINEIAFVNHEDWRIGFRRFGRHLWTYMSELIGVARDFCSKLDLNLNIKYFGIKSLHNDELEEIYNQTQIDCFKNFFVSNNFMEKTAYQFDDDFSMENNPEYLRRCDEVMHEQVENVITIDLFGFTEASQRVMDCIIKRNRDGKFIERVVILPAIVRFIDVDFELPQNDFIRNSKFIMDMTLGCLEYF